jgi:hypothetical protein
VVSRDTSEFVAAGVPVLDPWTGAYTPAGGNTITFVELARTDLLAFVTGARSGHPWQP